jgi:hypothetical protein
MIRVPLVFPSSLGSHQARSTDDELSRLEAQREQLLSMITEMELETENLLPPWFRMVMLFAVAGIGIALVAGLISGQIALSGITWAVVIVGLLLFILSRRVNIGGTRFYVWQSIWPLVWGLSLDGSSLPPVFNPQPVSKSEVRDQLAECEARIAKLKEDRL